MILFSDPHLGLRRTANTTPASRQRLQDALTQALADVIEAYPGVPKICGGDLFDSYSNPEHIIAQALPLVNELTWCLAGNHDLVNIADRKGSLQLLMEVFGEDRFAYTPFGSAQFHAQVHGDTLLVAIPHVADQALFNEALRLAYQIRTPKEHMKKLLLLHCNYDNGLARETDLNLARDQAADMLNVYDYIVLGHEHIPRQDFEGRLLVMGNLRPTGFADISDKFIWVWDGQGFTAQSVWVADDHVAVVDWRDVAVDYEPADPAEAAHIQFVRLTGSASASDTPELAKRVRRLRDVLPGLQALKVDVALEGVQATQDMAASLSRLPEKIAAELKGTDLEALWQELWQQETSHE